MMPPPSGTTFFRAFSDQVLPTLVTQLNNYIANIEDIHPTALTYNCAMTATGRIVHFAVLEYEVLPGASTKEVLATQAEDLTTIQDFLTTSNDPADASILASYHNTLVQIHGSGQAVYFCMFYREYA